MAVRNAVSAATKTFATISKILFFIRFFFYVTQISLISQIFNPSDYFVYVRFSQGVGSESWGLTQL